MKLGGQQTHAMIVLAGLLETQRGEVVAECKRQALMKKKPKA